MSSDRVSSHWLDQYASPNYRWRDATHDGRLSFYRPLGLVEFCFDADGRYYEGRADMNVQLEFEIKTDLNRTEFQDHVALAWACVRNRHVLSQARSLKWAEWMAKDARSSQDLFFVIDVPDNGEEAVAKARSQLVFLSEQFESVDQSHFYNHAQNSARIVDADTSLGKLFVLPAEKTNGETQKVTFLLVTSHQVQDGMAMYMWASDLIKYLNRPSSSLRAELDLLCKKETMQQHLPLPQEALYPQISGSRARQRWFWLLTRILRHVRKPLPAGFPNPLRRRYPLQTSVSFSPTYSLVLDYKRTPPNNTTTCRARTSRKSTARLHKICRDAGVSIGSGCFALAALLMMELYELREPDVPLDERKPFITGFPLNPRPFLSTFPPADSLMLAFCDGIMLPFLPSSLDLVGRLKLLALQAQRQLAVYQKRARPQAGQEGLQYMSSRGAGRVLAIQYLSSLERCQMIVPPQLRSGVNPQGGYPMQPNMTMQTCGVSSVGKGAPLSSNLKTENPDFIAVPQALNAGVRARPGEFLIGVGGGENGLWANVSVDLSTMDPKWITAWQHRFESILESSDESTARL